ncbi:adenosylcobinamide-GDP ribazoletransferase [Roseivivax sp. GX 12232]|uniref:adenosylcobinamide-GDP ribazoletransferase n=1 Tax=Roseivivax sp. GX 12232 TaxID=2900547 RepID=UPI001E301F27|nr:adenosylcobinamide-GDP ribazoletransferase [Roseivivax sp. GX 12232]MCE0504779.1 adenosylcobinamide-GDP ribazoletransferase [Roseivivax sp. GX 12232]
MRAVRRIREARLALMLLTRLPAGSFPEDPPALPESRWAWPLVGLVTGASSWGVFALAGALGLAPGIAALLVIGAGVLLTGGLHHDGLADSADGLWGGQSPERRLEIMRDSRIGSYGVLALILTLGLEWQALGAAGAVVGFPGFLLVGVASRLAMLLVSDLVPLARGDGLGASARGAGGLEVWWPGALALLVAALATGPGALWALGVMAALTLGVARLARAKIGGQTGDILGAVQVLTGLAGWLALAAAH